MSQARPSSYVALALATLALALALWWSWGTFTGLAPDDDAERKSADYLRIDEPYEPLPPADAKGEPASSQPALEGRRVALDPPERVTPEVLAVPPPPRTTSAPAPLPETPEEPAPAQPLRAESSPGEAPEGGFPAGARGSTEILVEEGRYWIGSSETWVAGLSDARGAGTYPGLELEAPRDQVLREAFWIDRYEVSDHRYFEFLQRTAAILYRTNDHESRTLVEIAQYLVSPHPANLDVAGVTGRQLFRANLPALLDAFSNSVVRSREGVVDLDATYEHLRDRNVPRGLELTFYDRAPPSHWPDMSYPAKAGDHPVRGISLEEALEYAMWRGRYVPDEIAWEIAARGPSGLDYPWGSDGRGYKDLVNGGKSLPRGALPFTLPVHLLGGGASWVGCYQMLGNVSEWTTSFLEPYPWSRLAPGPTAGQLLVTRGGSARDEDSYVVRPAFRGWREDDPEGPPRPDLRRDWTGFRTARLELPARSRVPVMHYLARKGGALDPDLLMTDLYEGLENEQDTSRRRIAGTVSAALPRPGVKDIVLQPLRVAALRRAGQPRFTANLDPGLDSLEVLLARSVHDAPVLLGLFHTDLSIVDVWQTGEPYRFAALDLRRLRRAAAPPGTYFVALVGGIAALLRTDLSAAWYVENRPATTATVNVIERSYRAGDERRPKIDLRPRGRDALEVSLEVPLHASASRGFAVTMRLRLDLDAGEVRLLRKPRFEAGTLR